MDPPESLDIKERIRLYNKSNVNSSNNNKNEKGEDCRKISIPETTCYKPSIAPKPLALSLSNPLSSKNVPSKATKPPIPKVPPNLLTGNSQIPNRKKSPIPPPKPRSLTVNDDTEPIKDSIMKHSYSVPIPNVNIHNDNSKQKKTPEVLARIPNSNTDQCNDDELSLETKPLQCDNNTNTNNTLHRNVDSTLSLPVVNVTAAKSPSIKQKRSSFNRDIYEDINVPPSMKTKIKNAVSAPSDEKRMTLDGVMLASDEKRMTLDGVMLYGGGGDDNDDHDDDPIYDQCYEHSPIFRRKAELPQVPEHADKNVADEKVTKELKDNDDSDDDLYTVAYEHTPIFRKDVPDVPKVPSIYMNAQDEEAKAKEALGVRRSQSDRLYLQAIDSSSQSVDIRRAQSNESYTRSTQHIQSRTEVHSTNKFSYSYDGLTYEKMASGTTDDLSDYDFVSGTLPPAVPSHGKTSSARSSSSGGSDDYEEPPCDFFDDNEDVPVYVDSSSFSTKPPRQASSVLPAIPQHKNCDENVPLYMDSNSLPTEPPRPSRSIVPSIPLHKTYEDDAPLYVDSNSLPTEPPKQSSFVHPSVPPHKTCEDDDDNDLYNDPEMFCSDAPKGSVNNRPPPIPKHVNSTSRSSKIPPPPSKIAPPPIPAHKTSITHPVLFDSGDEDGDTYIDPTEYISDTPKGGSSLRPPRPAPPKSPAFPESSSDDDSDHDYDDVTDMFHAEPPAPGSRKCRQGSKYKPTSYVPPHAIPSLEVEEYEEEYSDPDVVFASQMSEEIYSDEPLYQVYNDIVNKEIFRRNHQTDDDAEREDKDAEDSLHFANLVTGGGLKSMRLLWSELPSVRHSGTLSSISSKERKRQEAMFEVISSEASYLKSLDVLVSHFVMSKEFLPNPKLPSSDPNEGQILDRHEYHFLFSGISQIKGVSERFLSALRQRQQESVIFVSISDIVLDFAKNHFNAYINYCSNQVFQDRTLQSLLKQNDAFKEKLKILESDKKCQMLSMQSFLMLPMQRITRMPLLVDAICNQCDQSSDEYNLTDRALKAINSVVFACNEGTRKMERTEEMYFIQKTLTFKYKPIPLVSASRWLVKKGCITCSYEEGKMRGLKTQLRSMFKGQMPFYLFLFTDLVILAKMRSEDNFKVVDYCHRSMLKVEQQENVPARDSLRVGSQLLSQIRYAFTLIFLENVQSKTQEYHCYMEAESDITRWIEAINPVRSEVEDEAIYEEWDSPQVQVVYPYQSAQSDELSLVIGDIISVLRKLPDGWAEGCRLRDDEKGWFPINHTDEIDSKHMRAKNLMQRYRLLNETQKVVNQLSMR